MCSPIGSAVCGRLEKFNGVTGLRHGASGIYFTGHVPIRKTQVMVSLTFLMCVCLGLTTEGSLGTEGAEEVAISITKKKTMLDQLGGAIRFKAYH